MATLLITKTGGYLRFVVDGNTREVTNMRNDVFSIWY